MVPPTTNITEIINKIDEHFNEFVPITLADDMLKMFLVDTEYHKAINQYLNKDDIPIFCHHHLFTKFERLIKKSSTQLPSTRQVSSNFSFAETLQGIHIPHSLATDLRNEFQPSFNDVTAEILFIMKEFVFIFYNSNVGIIFLA
ncbi:hypothetical protein CDAR_72631 [Caerostris darwini]|uniref:Uncharacterized protein n=1 Tax=Caerostris darwini TaxID=1538125 RepID=A0AAV4MMY3_9ARAC|nr:hypothetical protein CDAR_72631 [Caerostris darwini]